jgi:tetratricopeptide (TPR) repeat protein
MAIIKIHPSVDLLSWLTGSAVAEMQHELDALVDEQFLIQRDNVYKFTHESFNEAALPWFEKQPRIKSWIRKNTTRACTPASFEECIARGRIWRYLNSISSAFEALNAAIAFAGSNFMFKMEAHYEMHELLKFDREHGRHYEFFDNFSAIGWYGLYALPITEQITLTEEAIKFHGHVSILDYPDPYYRAKLAELHRINTWLHIQNLDQDNYFYSAQEALSATTDIHEIAMMLNRYILICRNWGLYSCGIKGAIMSIVLCAEVPHEKDLDLLSVNYAMSAPLVAESEAGKEGRMSFTQTACDNPHATKRELAHAQLAQADSCTISGQLDEASHCLDFSKKVMKDLQMDSLSVSYHQSLGLWRAARGEWHEADAAFKRSLEKASWLGQKLEVLKAGQNLLIAYVKKNNFTEAEKLYQIILKLCFENFTEPDFKAAGVLLNGMIEKSHELLSAGLSLSEGVGISSRINQLASEFGIEMPPERKTCPSVFFFVLYNAKMLAMAFPEHFQFSEFLNSVLERNCHANSLPRMVNGISCEIVNVKKDSFFFSLIV